MPSGNGSGDLAVAATATRASAAAEYISASLPCPMLSKSNYVTWAVVMKVHLQARGLWDAIDATDPVDPCTDHAALATIHRGISRSTRSKISKKTTATATAKEAWQALRTMHLGTEPVMKARARALMRELEGVRMEEVESIDDLAARVMALVADVRAHGVEVEEGYTVEKLLRAVSPKFDQIACAIEVLCDLKSMTVEDLVDRLKAYEIRLQDQGLMTQAEWEAEMKKRDGEAGRGRGGRGKGIGCGDGERCNVFGKKGRKFDKSKVRCYNCQDYGHFASECRKVLYKSV